MYKIIYVWYCKLQIDVEISQTLLCTYVANVKYPDILYTEQHSNSQHNTTLLG